MSRETPGESGLALVHAIAMLAAGIAVWTFFIIPQGDVVFSMFGQETTDERAWSLDRAAAENQRVSSELARFRAEIDSLSTQLYRRDDHGSIWRDIDAAAHATGLKVLSVNPGVIDTSSTWLLIHPSVELAGDFRSVVMWIDNIERAPKTVRVQTLEVHSDNDGSGVVATVGLTLPLWEDIRL